MIKRSQSYSLKLIILCVLVVVMAIPAMFISYIVYERSSRADEAVHEVSERYGGAQMISGPVLAIPSWLDTKIISDSLERVTIKPDASQYIIFPETGEAVFAPLKSIVRQRGLFNVPTYQGQASMSAKFQPIETLEDIEGRIFDTDNAVIFFAISDPRGLLSDPVLILSNGERISMRPARLNTAVPCCDVKIVEDKITQKKPPRGLQNHGGLTYLYVPVGAKMDAVMAGELRVEFGLSGAQSLSIVPYAGSTQLKITSDWQHPGFDGYFPPTQQTISNEGFEAQWSVPFLARGIDAHGQAEGMGRFSSPQYAMKVNFISSLNPYRILNRALKYSVLFIGMVFLTFFLSELIMSVAIHPAQYGLVGLAQAVFYLLLLAFAEQVGFMFGFIISALATIGLTAMYAAVSFGDRGYALRYGGIFSAVYGLMFMLLNVQGVALLTSALVSFALIALTMYLTRDLDWYGAQEQAVNNLTRDKPTHPPTTVSN